MKLKFDEFLLNFGIFGLKMSSAKRKLGSAEQ